MPNELTLDFVQSQITPQQRLTVGEETVAEIQKLAEDPEYGEVFLDCYIDHLNIYKNNTRGSHKQYLNAVKFFSLVEAGNSLTDAYIKTFPERFEARTQPRFGKSSDLPENPKEIMRGEASRYNATQMVNDIRKVATIPVQLIHRHLLHEAILVNANLMNNARSEMVRQKAADTLIRELKPAEDTQIEVAVAVKSTVIEDYESVMRAMVQKQKELIAEGGDLLAITNASIRPVKVVAEGEAEVVNGD